MAKENSNNSLGWTGEYLDYLEGDHLVCAYNGNGNPDYRTLCLFARFGLGSWFMLLMVCSIYISVQSSRVRKRISVVAGFKKTHKVSQNRVAARILEIAIKLEVSMVGVLLFSGLMMFSGGFGIRHPPNTHGGIVGDSTVALTSVFSGQLLFWLKQHSHQKRLLLPKNTGKQIEDYNRWSVSTAIRVLEQQVTPLSYVVTMVLLTYGFISRSQYWTYISASGVFWGFALMRTLLFTRLKTNVKVARINNRSVDKRDVMQRREMAVWRMFVNLLSDLAAAFFGAVAHPLAILLFDTPSSSTKFLVFTSIMLPFDLVSLTIVAIIRFKVLKSKKRKLKNMTTDLKRMTGPSSFATSSIVEESTLHAYPNSEV